MKQKDCKNAPPASFARLAQRMTTWTTRGLLSAIVLVAGLGFGHQVLEWWRAEDASPNAPPVALSDGLGDPTQLHYVQFGDQPWSMSRQSLLGTRQAVSKSLAVNCRLAAERGGQPAGEPGDEERNLLAKLAGRKPVDEQPGQWRLYAVDEACPMAVVVRADRRAPGMRRAPGVSPGIGDSDEPGIPKIPGLTPRARLGDAPQDSGPNLAEGGVRVVVWGLAVPAGAEAWTLYTYQPESPGSAPAVGLPEIPIPGGCKNTLTIRVVGGGAMVGFEGPAEPEIWRQFYQRWFAQHGWQHTVPWKQSGANWEARFAPPPGARAGAVDVLFIPATGGRFTGLLLIGPKPW